MNESLSNIEPISGSKTLENEQIELIKKLDLNSGVELERETQTFLLEELKNETSKESLNNFNAGDFDGSFDEYNGDLEKDEFIGMMRILSNQQKSEDGRSSNSKQTNNSTSFQEVPFETNSENNGEGLNITGYTGQIKKYKDGLANQYEDSIENVGNGEGLKKLLDIIILQKDPNVSNLFDSTSKFISTNFFKQRNKESFSTEDLSDFNFTGEANKNYSNLVEKVNFLKTHSMKDIFNETINDNYKRMAQIFKKSSIDYGELSENAKKIKDMSERIGLFLFGDDDEIEHFLNLFDDLDDLSWQDIKKILKLNNKKKKWFLGSKDSREYLVDYINENGTKNLDDKILKQTFKIKSFENKDENVLYKSLSEEKLGDLMNNLDYSSLVKFKEFAKDIQNGNNKKESYKKLLSSLPYVDIVFLSDYIDTILTNLGKEKLFEGKDKDTLDKTKTYMNVQKSYQESKLLTAKKEELIDFSNLLTLDGRKEVKVSDKSMEDLNNDFKDYLLDALLEYSKLDDKDKNLAKFLSEELTGEDGIITKLSGDYEFNDSTKSSIIDKFADDPNIIEKLLKNIENDFNNGRLVDTIMEEGNNHEKIDKLYSGYDRNLINHLLQNGMNLEKNKEEIELAYIKDLYLKKISSSNNEIKIYGGDNREKTKTIKLDEDGEELIREWKNKIIEAKDSDDLKKIINDYKENRKLDDIILNKDGINPDNIDYYRELYFNRLGFSKQETLFTNAIRNIKEDDSFKEIKQSFQENKTEEQKAIEYTNNQIKNNSSFYEDFSENVSKHQGQNNSKDLKESNKDRISNAKLNTGETSNLETNYKNSNYAVSKKTDEKGNTVGWSLKMGNDEDSEQIEIKKQENINDNVRIIEKLLKRKGIDVDLVSKDRSKSMEASIFDKYKKIQDLSQSPEKIDFELIEGAVIQGIRKWVVDKIDNNKKNLKVPGSTISKIKSSQTNRSIDGLSEFFDKLKTDQKDWKDENNMYYEAISADDVGTSNGLIVMIEELEEMETKDKVYAMSNSGL